MGLGKGLKLFRAEKSRMRTLNDQIPIILCPLFSIITIGDEVIRCLPFSQSRT